MMTLGWKLEEKAGKVLNISKEHLINTDNPDIIILTKKIHIVWAQKIIKSLNLPNFMKISLEHFSGRLWLLWTGSVQFQLVVLVSTSRLIHYKDNIYIYRG